MICLIQTLPRKIKTTSRTQSQLHSLTFNTTNYQFNFVHHYCYHELWHQQLLAFINIIAIITCQRNNQGHAMPHEIATNRQKGPFFEKKKGQRK